MSLIERGRSEDITSKTITDIIRIPWGSEALSVLEKQEAYLRTLEAVHRVQSGSAGMESFGMFLMVFLLLHIVEAASAHPRIAVLTSTLRDSVDNLMHFGMIFVLVFCGFAQIACWRFGNQREDLSTFWAATKTQFNSLLDPPGSLGFLEDSSFDFEYILYAFLYHGICFFFLMNFVLAIIVDAYTKTEKSMQESGFVQSVLQDTFDIPRTIIMMQRHSWPSRSRIVEHLEHEVSSILVDALDLMPAGFQSEGDSQAFCNFYGRFTCMRDALEPEAEQVTEPLSMAVHELCSSFAEVKAAIESLRK